jgi:hypothetical protein
MGANLVYKMMIHTWDGLCYLFRLDTYVGEYHAHYNLGLDQCGIFKVSC